MAARALLTDEYAGRRPELPGPQPLSHRELPAALGQVPGRPLRMVEVPPEAAVQGMLRQGLPEPFVRALLARYAAHLRRPRHPGTEQVRALLGRPAPSPTGPPTTRTPSGAERTPARGTAAPATRYPGHAPARQSPPTTP